MDSLDTDILLFNLVFEEYLIRKRILDLKSSVKDIDDVFILQNIGKEINILRERANNLNNIITQKIYEKVR